MASNLKSYPLAKDKRDLPQYRLIRSNAERHSSLSRLARNRLLSYSKQMNTFSSGQLSTYISQGTTRSVCLSAVFLPPLRFSPSKFSIGVASVTIFSVIRLLLVKKREPPCRCSDSFKYRSVSSPGLLHLIMTVVLLFTVI